MKKKLIQFKNIVKEFDGKLVLKGVNLDIYENGEQTECWVPHSYGFELLDDVIPNNLHENE